MELMLLFLLFMLYKHLLCDWFFQPAWMAFRKHSLRNKEAHMHAGINALGTLIVLAAFFETGVLSIGLIGIGLLILAEYLIHMLIDAAKMNLNYKMNWKCDNSEAFWKVTGADQFLHLVWFLLVAAVIF